MNYHVTNCMPDSFHQEAGLAKRATIADIAVASGVSVATVDRVLNGRLPVREDTARRVYEAAESVGYHAAGLMKQRIEQEIPRYRLGFLLQQPGQLFYQAFARELQNAVAAASDFRGLAQLEFLDTQTPQEVSTRLKALGTRCQAVAMVAVDHPQITAAVAELKARGVPVFALLSDFAAGVRETYLGVDNRKVGRTAAWMIAKTAQRPGKIGLFIGSHRFHGHELREIGFRSYFREYAPQFDILETRVNLEADSLAHESTIELLQRHPDLVGLYVAGGGTEGVIAALREENMAGKLVAVCNELNAASRAALLENIVTMTISTPLPTLSRETVVQMGNAIRNGAADTPGQLFLPFDINIVESI